MYFHFTNLPVTPTRNRILAVDSDAESKESDNLVCLDDILESELKKIHELKSFALEDISDNESL